MDTNNLNPVATAIRLVLFYDFETTGLPLYREPSEDPRQPHAVQVGACLVDLETRVIISTLDVIVRPDGWTIPDDVAALHGITTERALAVGVPEKLALEMLLAMWRQAGERVGHNEPFDCRIGRIAIKRLLGDDALADEWKAAPAQCTAMLSKPICNLPPTEAMKAKTSFKVKTPNLGEAYQHFFGEPMANAHSALPDVHACIKVFFAVEDYYKAQPVTA